MICYALLNIHIAIPSAPTFLRCSRVVYYFINEWWRLPKLITQIKVVSDGIFAHIYKIISLCGISCDDPYKRSIACDATKTAMAPESPHKRSSSEQWTHSLRISNKRPTFWLCSKMYRKSRVILSHRSIDRCRKFFFYCKNSRNIDTAICKS